LQAIHLAETFNEHLAGFATMAEEQRLSCDPDQTLYEHAERRISELPVKPGVDLVRIGTLFSVELFAPIWDVPVLQNSASLPSGDLIWPAGHRYEECAEFADLVLQLISCATSESDAERVLSMEKNVTGLHGTRFSIRTIEARFRAQTAHFSPAVPSCVEGALTGRGVDQDVRAESDNSDDEQSEVGDDSDTEDS
jgi:hypothetical protein